LSTPNGQGRGSAVENRACTARLHDARLRARAVVRALALVLRPLLPKSRGYLRLKPSEGGPEFRVMSYHPEDDPPSESLQRGSSPQDRLRPAQEPVRDGRNRPGEPGAQPAQKAKSPERGRQTVRRHDQCQGLFDHRALPFAPCQRNQPAEGPCIISPTDSSAARHSGTTPRRKSR
jgi:hypothetical protein